MSPDSLLKKKNEMESSNFIIMEGSKIFLFHLYLIVLFQCLLLLELYRLVVVEFELITKTVLP